MFDFRLSDWTDGPVVEIPPLTSPDQPVALAAPMMQRCGSE